MDRLWTIAVLLLVVSLICLAFWLAEPAQNPNALEPSFASQSPNLVVENQPPNNAGSLTTSAEVFGNQSVSSNDASIGTGRVRTALATSTVDVDSDASFESNLFSKPQPTNRPIAVAGDGFVASDQCRDCHTDQHESWHASYHRTMTQVAGPQSVIGDFRDRLVRAYDRDFALTQRGEEFWVRMKDLDANERTSPEIVEREIVMTTGSHHMQIYWYTTDEGRTLSQLPVAWLRETKSWVPTSALFISPPPQPLRVGKRRWNEVCIKCHTTNGQPRIFAEEISDSQKTSEQNRDSTGAPTTRQIRVDTHVAEFGISCEACHGPGEQHVSQQLTNATIVADSSNTANHIVHPEKLDHVRSSQVCGQCHGNWLPDNEQGLDKYYTRGTCFRAGEDLSDSRHIFASKETRTPFIKSFLKDQPHYFEDRYWADGSIRVSGGEYNGMTNSACFAASDMSCLSCHQMHKSNEDPRPIAEWANDQLDATKLGNESCLQCHEQLREATALTSHTHHAVNSSGSECYNCHMPHTSYGLLKAIRSHRISNPSVQESTQFGRPNACNQCHIDQTLEWTGRHLETWYGIAAPSDLSDDEKKYSATALWCLTGDAGQRALAAWSLGWQSAQQASRTDWVAPVLAQMLADPYDAVRHITHRSLSSLPAYRDFPFNYTGPVAERQRAAVRAFKTWRTTTRHQSSDNVRVLLTNEGELLSSEFTRLNRSRNNRQVLLAE